MNEKNAQMARLIHMSVRVFAQCAAPASGEI
jgi:hypothetical protein